MGSRAGHEPAVCAAEEAAVGEEPLWPTPTWRADRRPAGPQNQALPLPPPPPSAAPHVVSHSHQTTVFREGVKEKYL